MDGEWLEGAICFYCGSESVYILPSGEMFCACCGEFLGYI